LRSCGGKVEYIYCYESLQKEWLDGGIGLFYSTSTTPQLHNSSSPHLHNSSSPQLLISSTPHLLNSTKLSLAP
jgi:hypothetical protein